MTKIRIGISPCPNDTFAFSGLLDGHIDTRDLDCDITLLDVQTLNESLGTRRFHVVKASFAAALHVTDAYGVLPVGSAVGFGVGPVLLARQGFSWDQHPEPRVALPGPETTAAYLFRRFHPSLRNLQHRVFSDIMPALVAKEVDLGVCIHEGRFTYQQQGLQLVEDLGATYETATGQPLPLGGLLALWELSPSVRSRVVAAIRQSLAHGRAHPEHALTTMRRYAQEMDDSVIWSHVDLYVNRWTEELGIEGQAALTAFEAELQRGHLLAPDRSPLRVVQEDLRREP